MKSENGLLYTEKNLTFIKKNTRQRVKTNWHNMLI